MPDRADMEWEGRPSDEELYGKIPEPKANCEYCRGSGTVTIYTPESYAEKEKQVPVDEPCPDCKGGTAA